ncbi:SCP2 sterol-binding domain-containing protein [Mycoavidus sp. HKI]|uniref:ubiquinone biosynthesis accessory factor UbiJ n=1 Tax=Mycoavidus sp. HKI TaxID=2840467 RepID=UPI001CBD11D7|nr:SCP2 sterol-binding domain-containing protein [Mycoavidus sp. HKI]UAW64405.1 SCP2 sterol-binding domain-containing protein [Mycoavidus sp. HKI]
MSIVAHSVATAINYLLSHEAWARARLMPYAGRKACVATPPLLMVLTVQGDGRVSVDELNEQMALEAPPCDVSITLPSAALFASLFKGRAAMMKQVKIKGDAEFAALLAQLAGHLRWEPEETLAQLIGDAPAYRLMRTTRMLQQQLRNSGRNLLEAVTEYLLDEDPKLVRDVMLNSFEVDIVNLNDDAARLEKRVIQIEKKMKVRTPIDTFPHRVSN